MASRTLLRSIGQRRTTEGLLPVVNAVLRTMAMHAYAGAMTARGVLDGARGRGSSFLRTPKKASGLNGEGEDPARMIG